MPFQNLLEDAETGASMPADPFEGAPSLDECRKMFRVFQDSTAKSRKDALRDSAYYHHDGQLSAEVRAELARRRQPPAIWNKIFPAVNGVLGLLETNQTDAQAIGRNDEDEEAANVVTQVLRYCADRCDFDQIKKDAASDFLIYGAGIAVVEVDERGDPRIAHVPFKEFFYDPMSNRHHFEDASYMGRARWVDSDVARRIFPEARQRLGDIAISTFDGSGPDCEIDQREMWLDGSRRVRIIEMYLRDGKTGGWNQVIFCHAGLLHFSPSPYRDDDDQSVSPFIATSFEVNDQGDRYGMIRRMIQPQDVINNLWSKQTHILNSAQIEYRDDGNGMPVDVETARKEAARPDGVLPAGVRRVPMNDVFSGTGSLLQIAIQEIERMAPSPALLGRGGGANESGRARQILQQAGFTELATPIGRLERWELRAYRHLWFRAAQYMTDERTILVTDDTGSRKKLALNKPQVEQQITEGFDPLTGDIVPTIQQVEVGKENDLAKMDMDINLKTVRHADTLRGEGVEKMLEWSGRAGVSVLDPQFEFVLEMSDIPQKQYLLNKWRQLAGKSAAAQAEQAQAQAQQAQQLQAVNQAATESKIMRDQAQADKDGALAAKHGAEAQNEQLEAAMNAAMLEGLGAV